MKCFSLNFISQLILMFSLVGCGGGGSGVLLSDPKPKAALIISGSSVFNFGSHALNSSTTQLFTVSNVGSVSATQITSSFYLSINFSFEGGNFPGIQGTCLPVVEPGDSCTVSVVFSPQALGFAQSSLQLSYDDGSTTVLTSPKILSGTGI